MKKLLKRLLPVTIVLCMFFALGTQASAEEPVTGIAPISAPIATPISADIPYFFVNDQLLAPEDALPVIAVDTAGNAVTMIPLRAAFEALGATVNYDAETKLITVEFNGVVFSFVSGENTANYGGDVTSTVTNYIMDPAPVFSNGRTLIPSAVFSDCFGLVISDSFFPVYITDVEALFAKHDTEYTIMSAIMAASISDQTIKQTGTYSGSIAFAADGTAAAIPFAGDFSTLSNGANSSGSMSLGLELDEIMSALAANDLPVDETLPLYLSLLENISIDYIVNTDTGVMYIGSPILGLILGVEVDWLELDFASLGTVMPSMSDLDFDAIVEYMAYSMAAQPGGYMTADYILSVMKSLASDDCFTVSGTADAPVYTLEWDKSKLEEIMYLAINMTGEELTDEIKAEFDAVLDAFVFDCKIVAAFNADGSYTSDVNMNMAFALEGIEMKMTLEGTSECPGTSSLDLYMYVTEESTGMEFEISVIMEYDTSYVTDSIPSGPAADDTVLNPFTVY